MTISNRLSEVIYLLVNLVTLHLQLHCIQTQCIRWPIYTMKLEGVQVFKHWCLTVFVYWFMQEHLKQRDLSFVFRLQVTLVIELLHWFNFLIFSDTNVLFLPYIYLFLYFLIYSKDENWITVNFLEMYFGTIYFITEIYYSSIFSFLFFHPMYLSKLFLAISKCYLKITETELLFRII